MIRSFPSAGGVGVGIKFTTVLLVAVPPVPLHARVYVVVATGVTTSFPDVGLEPVQPSDAIHEVASVELQVSVDVALPAPGVTLVGFALSDTVGAGGGVGVGTKFTVAVLDAVPPAPVQSS